MRHHIDRARTTAASIAVAAMALVVFSLATPPPSAQAGTCPNEARREEQGEPGRALPDCRAYEVVSPPQSEPARSEHIDPVSPDGDRIGFYTQFGPAPGSPGGSSGPYYLSTRGPEGWSTLNQIPPQSTNTGLFCGGYLAGYSADLSRSVFAEGWNWTGYPTSPDDNGTINCGHDEPLLLPDEPQGAQNIFLHATDAPNEAGFYQLLNLTPSGLPARNAYFQAGSADFSHIVFTSPLQLTPEAPLPPEQTAPYSVGEDLYGSADGALRLLTVLPDGTPTWGILANTWQSYEKRSSASYTNAVSGDAERVLFYGDGEQSCQTLLAGTRCDSSGAYRNANLYLRRNAFQQPTASGECSEAEPGRACTAQVDERNSGAPGPSGGGHFQWASANGSRVFFTDCTRLTTDSTAVSSSPGGCGDFGKSLNELLPPTGNDLYEWDAEKPARQRLTDLSVDHNSSDPLGADVQGVAGISEDGSSVYFVANGVLTGAQQNSQGAAAQAGRPNIYLRHAGTTTFIATLEPKPDGSVHEQEEWTDWSSYTGPETQQGTEGLTSSRVSPDGRFLAFNSQKSLTGYDNTVGATGEAANEIYLYAAAGEELSCASCDPEGRSPTAKAAFEQPRIDIPLAMGETWQKLPSLLSGQLSDSGQVFFETTNSLLPADLNAEYFDVYEYEEGHLHLISAGTGQEDSRLRNASPNGANVFFTTAQSLVGSDADNATSLYDARAGGGFPEPPPAPVCETEEACHTAHQQPPAVSAPGSAHFQGPEEDAGHPICAKGQVKKKGKCVKKQQKKTKKHKKAKKKKGKSASSKHGGHK
jgi:hypothetical protein